MKLLTLLYFFSICPLYAVGSPEAVYGEDDRKDLFEISNPKIIKNLKSTMVFTLRGLINHDGKDRFNLANYSLQDAINLCPEQKFTKQPAIGVCSSVLVSPKHVLTAGHCVPHQDRCNEIYLSFGYHLEKENLPPRYFDEKEVYRCKKLLIRNQDGFQDFALIELDREVNDRDPVELDFKNIPKRGEDVYLIGYPDGIPSKVAQDAVIRQSHPKMFRSNVDAFRGNSGSGVFNAKTGALIGLLFKGDRDYSVNTRRGCYEARVHHQYGGRGEDATTIFGIWPLIRPYLE